MRSSLAASALLAGVFAAALLSGCGSQPSGAASQGSCSGAKHTVEVVVELGDHHVVTRCVGFSAAELSGVEAMKRSGIEMATQSSSYGLEVCQIDNQPKSYTECYPPAPQPYWSLFVWKGSGPWKSSDVGISEVKLRSGEALGWRYVPDKGTAPPPPKPPKS